MSPEAQLHEHALHGLQQAEALQRTAEALRQHAEAVPHIHEAHDHHPHEHHIEMREAHACAPDCPEHGGGRHDHHTHEHHHGHEHAQEVHTIQRKAPEHACSADCPEHGHGHHDHTTHHKRHEHKESHHASHKIEHKAHACTADCPEHGHKHDHHEHKHGAQKVELKEHHACAPDCPEHSHASHKHHEHKGEASHDIVQKASEHACGADCPEHGHGKSRDHTTRHEHHQERHTEVREKVSSLTEQQTEATRIQHRIEEELRAREPQPIQAVKQNAPSEVIIERQAAHAQRAAAERLHRTMEKIVAVEPSIEAAREKTEQEVVDTAANPVIAVAQPVESQFMTVEADGAETASESRPTFPATMHAEMAAESDTSAMTQISEAGIADDYKKALHALDEINLPLLQLSGERHLVEQKETVFDIPALLAELPTQASTQPAESVQAEHIPISPAVIPELPATPEPLNMAAATVAEAIAQRYQSVAEALGAEDDMPPLSPVQIFKLRAIVAAIQARAIQPENLATPSMVMPQELVQLLHLLGFENPAKTFERYIQQYGYGFYNDLLAHLFELLRHSKPIEAPILQASSVTATAHTDWTTALGKAAVLLVMLARQFVPSQALHLNMKQTKGAVS